MIWSAAGAALLFLLTVLQVDIIVDLLPIRLIQRRLAVSKDANQLLGGLTLLSV